jgi:hypothetical protein
LNHFYSEKPSKSAKYDPQSTGINVQSPQSESTPRRLTLLMTVSHRAHAWNCANVAIHLTKFQISTFCPVFRTRKRFIVVRQIQTDLIWLVGYFCQYWNLNSKISSDFEILIVVSKARFQKKSNGQKISF